MITLAPVPVLQLTSGGHTVTATGRAPGWPVYFPPDVLAQLREMDWYARRARLRAHECYLTATRVFVGAFTAPRGGEEAAQRAVIAAVRPALAAAGIQLPPVEELSYNLFAGSPNRVSAPGFLTPAPVRAADGVVVDSVQIDC